MEDVEVLRREFRRRFFAYLAGQLPYSEVVPVMLEVGRLDQAVRDARYRAWCLSMGIDPPT